MGVLESIKSGWQVVVNSIVLMGIIFVINAVTAMGMLSVIGINPTPQRLTELTGALLLMFLFLIIIWIFVEGGILSAVLGQIKTRQLNLSGFLANGAKFFVSLLALNLISAVLNTVIWFIGSFAMGIFLALGKGQNIFFNILALVFLVVTIVVSFCVIIPILMAQLFCVAKESKAIASLRAGFSLFTANWKKVIGLFLLLGLFAFALQFLLGLTSVAIANVLAGWAGAIVNVILTSAANSFTGVFGAACLYAMLLSLKNEHQREETEVA